MKEPKSKHITRKTYYLTLGEKSEIRKYITANPNLTQEQIGERFGVSRGTVSNISREPRDKNYYIKKISELTNLVNILHNRLFQLQCKLHKYERQ